jgi:hypothetical protein
MVSVDRCRAARCKAIGRLGPLAVLLVGRGSEASAAEAPARSVLAPEALTAMSSPSTSARSSPLPDDATTSDARAGRVESGGPVAPAAAESAGGVGDFPGAFWVPGTSVRLRIGGFARLNAIHNWTALGADDRFVVATIPVEGDVEAGKGQRSSWSVAQTRVSLDSRMPSGWGLMRTYLEADFFGAGNTFRIRHAYGQVGPLLIGQTWSTFTDPRVSPELIDFEGQDGSVKVRQPVIRATWSPTRWYSASLALESNQTQATGGVAAPQLPDALARISVEGDFGLVFVSAVARKLAVESAEDPGQHAATTGVGVSASAWLPLPFLSTGSDATIGVTVGRGVARYLVGPSGAAAAEGGKDVVYDPVTNVARALPVMGAFLAVRFFWLSNLRSTLCYSGASVGNVADAPPDSYDETHYAALNLIYSPVERVDLGAEMLAGSRRNQAGAWGSATQTQLAATWRF